jgi:hypothetical protein
LLLLLCLGGVLWYIFRGTPDPAAVPAATTSASSGATTAPPVVPTTPAATSAPATTPSATTAPGVPPTASPTPSTGTGTGTIVVPNVGGKTGKAGRATLEGAGFTNIKIVTKDGSSEALTEETWIVSVQTPAAGSSVAANTEIILTIEEPTGKG